MVVVCVECRRIRERRVGWVLVVVRFLDRSLQSYVEGGASERERANSQCQTNLKEVASVRG